MPRQDGIEAAKESLHQAAKFAAAAAYRAPQITAGLKLKSEIITGKDLEPIVEYFEAIIPVSPVMYFDFQSLKYFMDNDETPPILLIGADLTQSELGWDCGACGFETCAKFNAYSKKHKGKAALFSGPSCNWKVIDFGVACDFACAAVSQFRLDCRPMGTIGCAAAGVGFLPDCSAHIGIPIGPPGDFRWFSRSQNIRATTYEMQMKWLRQTSPTNWQAFPGSTRPCTKTKQDWWSNMEYIKFEPLSENEIFEANNALKKVQEVGDRHYHAISKWYDKKGR